MPPENPQPNQNAPLQNSEVAPAVSASPVQTVNTESVTPSIKPKSKTPFLKRTKLVIILTILLFVICMTLAFFIGKHGERIIIRPPTAPPITLPPQAIVVADCVPGLGKQYVIPKDIPNGPIYDVKNRKVIAVEYNYKAIDLFINPDRLSNTIIPLTKSYQINNFTTTIGDLKGGTAQDAQNVPVHLTIYVVTKAEAKSITCPNTKSS